MNNLIGLNEKEISFINGGHDPVNSLCTGCTLVFFTGMLIEGFVIYYVYDHAYRVGRDSVDYKLEYNANNCTEVLSYASKCVEFMQNLDTCPSGGL